MPSPEQTAQAQAQQQLHRIPLRPAYVVRRRVGCAAAGVITSAGKEYSLELMCCLVPACPATPVMCCLPRRFFESLYAALAAVLAEAFERLDRKVMLEQELGRLFRCVAWRGRRGGGTLGCQER
jgi:hypothetical protein